MKDEEKLLFQTMIWYCVKRWYGTVSKVRHQEFQSCNHDQKTHFYTTMNSWRVFFSLQFVRLSVNVLCLLTNKIPAEQMLQFWRSFR